MMKKMIALLLAGCMTAAMLAGCGSEGDTPAASDDAKANVEDTNGDKTEAGAIWLT